MLFLQTSPYIFFFQCEGLICLAHYVLLSQDSIKYSLKTEASDHCTQQPH